MTLYEEIKLLLKRNGIEIKEDEESLFVMEVDGLPDYISDVLNRYKRAKFHVFKPIR